MQTLYLFVRTIYNAYEPDNTAYIWGVAHTDNHAYFRKVLFDGAFKDGACPCAIIPEGRTFRWYNNHLHGVANTFAEAWAQMPALLTDPDHYEDTPMVQVARFALTELEPFWLALRRAKIPFPPHTPELGDCHDPL